MKQVNVSDFKISGPVKISELQTHEDFGASEKKLVRALEETREDLGSLQDTLYAHGKYGVWCVYREWTPPVRTA